MDAGAQFRLDVPWLKWIPQGTNIADKADNYRGRIHGYETMLKISVSMGFSVCCLESIVGDRVEGRTDEHIYRIFTDFPTHVWSADWLRIPSGGPSVRMQLLQVNLLQMYSKQCKPNQTGLSY